MWGRVWSGLGFENDCTLIGRKPVGRFLVLFGEGVVWVAVLTVWILGTTGDWQFAIQLFQSRSNEREGGFFGEWRFIRSSP